MPLVGLGPLETIVNVGWGAASLFVDYAVMQNGEKVPPPILLTELPWAPAATVNICEPDAAIALSKTSKQPLWIKAPPVIQDVEGAVDLHGTMVFYLGALKALAPRELAFRMTMPQAGENKVVTDILYWLWGSDFGATTLEENMAHPYTTGDPLVGATAVMQLPRQFFNAADRDAYLTLGVATWHGAERSTTGERFLVGEWSFRATTFKGRTATTAPIDTVSKQSPSPEAPVPPISFVITVDYQTLKISAVQQ